MGFEQLPGYDAWKTAGPPERGYDYERGLEHHAADASELCEAGHWSCDMALWGGDDGDEFEGCSLGITDMAFAVVGDGEDCPEVLRKAEDFNAREHDMGL